MFLPLFRRPLGVPALVAALCLLALPGTADTLRATAGDRTPLDDYVAAPDDTYAWSLVSTAEGKDYTGYVLEMTSQTWRSPEEVDQPVWKHWLEIVVPAKVTTPTALMVISGGSSRSEAPKGADANLRRAVRATGAVCAQIRNIPNQPLVFADDGKRRSEDAIIAHNWDKYLRTGDPTWLTRFPMTKAVVRAMDTVQAFCAGKDGGGVKVENFVVAGASKRGWTTWTTAAVDNRVIAAMPMVIDMLNLVPSFKHHYELYGFWAPAINDYTDMRIMEWLESPEFAAMLAIVDPYSYRARLTMPKYLMNGAGDQFFLHDSWKYYLHDLQGPTYLRYSPNSGHGLENGDPAGALIAFMRYIVDKAPLPEYAWSFPDDNTIRATASPAPKAVKLWQATNPESRDFRVDAFGRKWTSTDLSPEADGGWVGRVETPPAGHTAFLVEFTFAGRGEEDFVVTTPVRVVPDTTAHTFTSQPDLWKDGFLHRQAK
ncbi:MAG TPA: PhoPQ-activated pathogenicity-related family protein [Candidatus Hydrogenedentes bacterium]|nr:PhoPQ-activated pathogenicity-related family protein [Candidatus Hydrogenedentota bacterium]HRZ84161.1 PhoPQ-activated pathogenicity-related family protein [Candidatus Hydrogenedentota bacterium]